MKHTNAVWKLNQKKTLWNKKKIHSRSVQNILGKSDDHATYWEIIQYLTGTLQENIADGIMRSLLPLSHGTD